MTASVPAPTLPLVVATATDPIARQTAIGSILLDLPGAVVVDYRLSGSGAVRRIVSDWVGTVYGDEVVPESDCVSCTVREDLVASVQLLAEQRRWSSVVVFPPLTASPTPIAHQLHHAVLDGDLTGVTLTSVVTFVDLARLREDLLGDDLVDERGLALSQHDRRSVGEAVAAQVEFSDVVVAVSAATLTEETLLRRIVAPTSELHLDWTRFPAARLLQGTYDHRRACDRLDPLRVPSVDQHDLGEVWTVALETRRPLHPDRLRANIEALGTGQIRARGHFWLASRPDVVCIWDACGGQLSLGSNGGWSGEQPGTRLVVTGVVPAERDRIVAAFDRISMTSDEAGTINWTGVDDGFEPWLG